MNCLCLFLDHQNFCILFVKTFRLCFIKEVSLKLYSIFLIDQMKKNLDVFVTSQVKFNIDSNKASNKNLERVLHRV